MARHWKSTYWFLSSNYLHFELSEQTNTISSMCTLQTHHLESRIPHQSSSMYLSCSAHDALALPRSFNTTISPTCSAPTQISIYTSLESHSQTFILTSLKHSPPHKRAWCVSNHRAGDRFLLHDCFYCSSYSSCKLNTFPYLKFSLQIFCYQYFLSWDHELCKANSYLCVSSD